MNNLYKYGLEAAEVGKTLIEPELVIPTAPFDKRRQLFSMGNVYVPKKNNPENPYFTYCAATIDAILDLYNYASYDPYEQIKRQWGTPGCQSIIKPFLDEVSKNRNASQYFFALSKLTASMAIPDNEDWKKQENYIAGWIKRCCNRQSDLKKGKVNIQAETSQYLVLALAFRSVADYQGLSFNDMNVYRGKAKGIMEQRTHSRDRDKLIQAFKKAGLNLQYGDNIRDTAHLWVRVRILSTMTISQFAEEEMGITKRKLLDRLLPFDKAMGYDRHAG